MGKSQVVNQFEVDTKGTCFMCFKEIRPRKRIFLGGDSSDSDDPDWEENSSSGGGSGSLSSLQKLSRYLNLDMEKVFTSETTSIPSQLLPNLQKSELKVTLCRGCRVSVTKFGGLLAELQKIKLQLGHCLKSILGKLVKAEKDGEAKQGYWDRMVDNPQALMHVKIVEKLRKEAIEKCSHKVDMAFPKVHVERIDEPKVRRNSVSSGAGARQEDHSPPSSSVSPRPRPVSPPSTPVPVASDKENRSKDRLKKTESLDSKEDNKSKPEPRVSRFRPIIMSSSSSPSSSDSEEEVEKALDLSAPAPANTSWDFDLDSIIGIRTTSNPSDCMRNLSTSSSVRKSLDVSKRSNSRASSSASATTRESSDGLLKRLYPFKCRVCHKRFKSENTFESHEHSSSTGISSSEEDEETSRVSSATSPPAAGSGSPHKEFPVRDLVAPRTSDIGSNILTKAPAPPKICLQKKLPTFDKAGPHLKNGKKLVKKPESNQESRKLAMKPSNSVKSREDPNSKGGKKKRKKKKNAIGLNIPEFKCSQCSISFKLQSQLRDHFASFHVNQFSLGNIINDPMAPIPMFIPEPEDDFKIEYILPNNEQDQHEDMIGAPEVVDAHISEDVYLDVPNPAYSFPDGGSQIASASHEQEHSCNSHGNVLSRTTATSVDENVEEKVAVPVECLLEVEKEMDVKCENGWTSLTAAFQSDSACGEIKTESRNNPDLSNDIEVFCLSSDDDDDVKEITPVTITGDVNDQENSPSNSNTTPRSSSSLRLQLSNCVQPMCGS